MNWEFLFWRFFIPFIIPILLASIYLGLKKISGEVAFKSWGLFFIRVFNPLPLIYYVLVVSAYITSVYIMRGIPPIPWPVYIGFSIFIIAILLHYQLITTKFIHPRDHIPDSKSSTVIFSFLLAIGTSALVWTLQNTLAQGIKGGL